MFMNSLSELENVCDTILMSPNRLCAPGSWIGHIPFSFWLIAQTEPRILVELGTHTGNSYFAFCQAVLANRLSTRCYAVDTWEGDEQAGYYGEEVYAEVSHYNDQHYAAFSRLIRSTFASAVNSFADGSIDLLHIDGLHSYEAVKEDFETWRPKLSDRSIVLLHDTNVKQEGFGVWRLWQELSEQYPYVHFEHAKGLGVLFVGIEHPAGIEMIFLKEDKARSTLRIKNFFTALGRSLELDTENKDLRKVIKEYGQTVDQRDESIANLIRQVSAKKMELSSLERQLSEKDQEISVKVQEISAKDQEISVKYQEISAKDQQISAKDQQIFAKEKEVAVLIKAHSTLQQLLTEEQETILRLTQERNVLLGSRSWRLTRPLRWCGTLLRAIITNGKNACVERFSALRPLLKKIYHWLPLHVTHKASLRTWYYRRRASKFWSTGKPACDAALTTTHTGLAMKAARGQILLIERWVPKPDQDAGSVMIFNFIQIFRNLGYAVTFYPVNLSYDPYYTPQLEKLGVTCLHPPEVHSLEQHLSAHGSKYDLVLTCRPDSTDPLLHLLKAFCPQARILYETHDLHYIREQRQAEIEKKPAMLAHAAQRKVQELRIAATVDCTLVVSEQERQTLLKENPDLSVEVIPVISEIYGCRAGFADRHGLIFIGGYEHRPNVDAVLFFAREILPQIILEIPDIRLHVVGSHPPEEITSLASENIIIHGFVRDISELMDKVKISVNPLRFGAGVKGKMVTSMSYGVPCIGTGIAVEGMDIVAGHQALVADDPAAFAQAVVRLSTDQALWEQLSAESLAFVRQRFSLEFAEAAFVRIFKKLLPNEANENFVTQRIASYDQFCKLERTDELARRKIIEASLAAKPEPMSTVGFCFVCNQRVLFHTDLEYGFPQPDGGFLPNWRERMVCPECQLNNRMRASIHLFHLLCNPAPESHLYLTEQETPLFAWFRNSYQHVIGSEFLGDVVAKGTTNQTGVRNEDLTALSFADEAFDAILSFDVFEHIPDYEQAIRECLRCLKPGGALFFTVPFDHQSEQHIVRAELNADGEVNHLLAPEYHGNPINPDGCLCYYHFGWDLLDQLRSFGFRDAAAYSYWSQHFGYLGGDQLLFRAVK